ncbi:MAG: hypothetical protein VW008_05080, partial [Aquiluna sp.]
MPNTLKKAGLASAAASSLVAASLIGLPAQAATNVIVPAVGTSSTVLHDVEDAATAIAATANGAVGDLTVSAPMVFKYFSSEGVGSDFIVEIDSDYPVVFGVGDSAANAITDAAYAEGPGG